MFVLAPDLPADIKYDWLTYDDASAEAWKRLLSGEERKRMAAFGSEKRQRDFLIGRVAARRLLAERLSKSPEEIELVPDDDGALSVGDDDLCVSITHAGPHAVAAVGHRRLGVDLERVGPRLPGVQEFLCGPDEDTMLSSWSLPHQDACILCWTLKEATLKALRTGFRLSPKKVRLSVDLNAERGTAAVEDYGRWELRFRRRKKYYLSLAYEDHES